jgi:hypothetical protein
VTGFPRSSFCRKFTAAELPKTLRKWGVRKSTIDRRIHF